MTKIVAGRSRAPSPGGRASEPSLANEFQRTVQPDHFRNPMIPEISALQRLRRNQGLIETKARRRPGKIISRRMLYCLSSSRHVVPVVAVRRGVAQPGRAPGSGPGGRRFKSSLPDHIFLSLSQSFTLTLLLRFLGLVSVHSVQLRAVRNRSRIVHGDG